MEIREYYKEWIEWNKQFSSDEKTLSMNEAVKLFRDFKYAFCSQKECDDVIKKSSVHYIE